MFPSLAWFSREGNICCGNKFAARKQKKIVFCLKSKTFLLPGHKCCFRKVCFQSQFSHHERNVDQFQCYSAQVKSNLVPRVFSGPGNEVGSEVEVEETGKKERNWKDE